MYGLSFMNETVEQAGAMVVRLAPPYDWADLATFLDAIDPTADEVGEPPDWVVFVGATEAERRGMVALGTGIHGAICLIGDWPAIRFVSGAAMARRSMNRSRALCPSWAHGISLAWLRH